MHDTLAGLVPALLAGAAPGMFFFAGLWWTVRWAAALRHPALAVLASLLLRTGLTLGGFLALAGGQWPRWLMCLQGFGLARLVVVRALRPPAPGGRHAA